MYPPLPIPMEDVCRVLTNCMSHKVPCLGETWYLEYKLSYREEITQRRTRQDRKLHFPQVRFEVGRRSFTYFGPALYNDTIKSYDVSMFKNKMKNIQK
ncbi:hypothetical protein J6590_083112 [Homalodisca vitripennis]|nr:hypothetical protein J6590_083112 [Homalodisca vitripennis]